MSVSTLNEADTHLSITRIFDAAPQRVFNAWLEPDQMAKWMGPRAFVAKAEILEMDRRVGGRYRVRMVKHESPQKSPDSLVGGVYKEITPHSKLVFTWIWDKAANCGSAEEQPASPAHEDGIETLITVTFKPIGSQTEMTLLHEHFPSVERRDSHNFGWNGSLDQLGALLSEPSK